MALKKSRLLIKFGKRENLEKLKEGNIYFNSIRYYRNDGTNFRGDPLEGKCPIDPTSIRMYHQDGTEFFSKYLPYVASVYESIAEDDDVLMFCAAALDDRVLTQKEDGLYYLCNEFQKEMKKFGDFAMILWERDLLEHIRSAKDESNCEIYTESGKIIYRDKTDYSFRIKNTGSPFDFMFDKDVSSYGTQNEWRVIIDGDFTLNDKGGYTLRTYPFDKTLIFPSGVLLKTFCCGQRN